MENSLKKPEIQIETGLLLEDAVMQISKDAMNLPEIYLKDSIVPEGGE